MTRVVIVEDNIEQSNYLTKLLVENFADIKVVATTNTIESASKLISTLMPDLLFLDIELGNRTAFELLALFQNPTFSIIFQTAHEHYALQAIKISCLEYLLKPIGLDELKHAVQKFYLQQNILLNQKRIEILLENIASNNEQNTLHRITIPVNDEFRFVNIRDIIYCKADSSFTLIITGKGEQIFSTKSLRSFEEILPSTFFRCHKSIIINTACINSYNKANNTITMINNDIVEISFRKKEEFHKLFYKM